MDQNKSIAAVILAAGQGKRMQSELPKVLHEVGGKPLLFYSIETLKKLALGQIITVLKYKADLIINKLKAYPTITIAIQGDVYGSGKALEDSLSSLKTEITDLMVIYADNAMFVKPETYQRVIDEHVAKGNTITFATRLVDEPKSSGKIVRDEAGNVLGIVEKKDATEVQQLIKEVNPGLFLFKRKWVSENITSLKPSSVTGEYYVTDLVGLAFEQKQPVDAINMGKTTEWKGVTTLQDVQKLNEWIKTANE